MDDQKNQQPQVPGVPVSEPQQPVVPPVSPVGGPVSQGGVVSEPVVPQPPVDGSVPSATPGQ